MIKEEIDFKEGRLGDDARNLESSAFIRKQCFVLRKNM